MFNKNSAKSHMTNLTDAQAERWAKIANQEYQRRIKIPEAKAWVARALAIKKANLAFVGKTEDQTNVLD